MARIKLATFSCEWMVSIFARSGRTGSFQQSQAHLKVKTWRYRTGSEIEDVPGPCKCIAAVIREMNAEILGFRKAPRADQMQALVDRFLKREYIVFQCKLAVDGCIGSSISSATVGINRLARICAEKHLYDCYCL